MILIQVMAVKKRCILLASLLASCNLSNYQEKPVKLTINSEIADCEEQNVHFKVVSILDSSESHLEKGDFLLPVCESEDCKDLIYRVSQLDTNRVFEVEGYLSEKGHNNIEYGCVGALKLKVVSCIELSK